MTTYILAGTEVGYPLHFHTRIAGEVQEEVWSKHPRRLTLLFSNSTHLAPGSGHAVALIVSYIY